MFVWDQYKWNFRYHQLFKTAWMFYFSKIGISFANFNNTFEDIIEFNFGTLHSIHVLNSYHYTKGRNFNMWLHNFKKRCIVYCRKVWKIAKTKHAYSISLLLVERFSSIALTLFGFHSIDFCKIKIYYFHTVM